MDPREELSASFEGLAQQGAWRAIADALTVQQLHPALTGPALTKVAWYVLSLAKLREYERAAKELAQLGDLSGEHYLKETAQGAQYLVPFILRWVHADIPGRMGQPKLCQQRFYSLFDFCREQLEQAHNPPTEASSGSGAPPLVDLWQERQARVAYVLVNLHLRGREYVATLRWLSWLLKRFPESPQLLSRVAYVQLIMGDTKAAVATFHKVAALVQSTQASSPGGRVLVRLNRGLQLFTEQNFAGAQEEFEAVLAEEPHNAFAANNRAICLMYACKLQEAARDLEESVQRAPQGLMREVVLQNLTSMFDLSSSTASAEAKHRLAGLVSRYAPDDFDRGRIRGA